MKATYIRRILFLLAFWMFAGIFVITYEGAILGFAPVYAGETYNYLRNLFAVIAIVFLAGGAVATFEVLYIAFCYEVHYIIV